jgi:uncharacterized protein YqfA (UPF0365 family)
MWLRGTLRKPLLLALVPNDKSGLGYDVRELEAHLLSGRDVEQLVKAGIRLKVLGEDMPAIMLSSLALRGHDLTGLVASFANARERYPDFEFKELVARHLEGEDVIAAANDGSIIPDLRRSRWLVRAESSTTSESDTRQLIGRLERGAEIFVRFPQQEQWRRCTKIAHVPWAAPPRG